jgi:hypothetical protein
MLKHTAKPKSLNEIVIKFSPGGMLETDSPRSIRKLANLDNGEPCRICLAVSCHCGEFLVSGLTENVRLY